MGLSFTAIDFETASQHRHSACAVGLAKVVDGEVVESTSVLIRPAPSVAFNSHNVAVHGITARDVADAPSWDELWPWLRSFIGDDVLIAHNASFDRSVMRNTCDLYDIWWGDLPFACTYRLAQSTLRLGSYSLPWVARDLGIESFAHHDAEADAIAAAKVAVMLAQLLGVDEAKGLVSRSRSATSAPRRTVDYANVDMEKPLLVDEFVVFTGGLETMSRESARMLVHTYGGLSQSAVTKKTTMVVVGDFDITTLRPGASVSSKLQKALDAVAGGQRLEILNEREFVEMVTSRECDFDALSEFADPPS